MRTKVIEALERKQKKYREINAWIDSNLAHHSSADSIAEWENSATECNAQIQLLLFLLSDDVYESKEEGGRKQEMCWWNESFVCDCNSKKDMCPNFPN